MVGVRKRKKESSYANLSPTAVMAQNREEDATEEELLAYGTQEVASPALQPALLNSETAQKKFVHNRASKQHDSRGRCPRSTNQSLVLSYYRNRWRGGCPKGQKRTTQHTVQQKGKRPPAYGGGAVTIDIDAAVLCGAT